MSVITLTLLVILTMLFLTASNSLSLGLILLFQTIMTSLFLGTILKTTWFSYILMIIFIGGLLILFLYVISILPNEKFVWNTNKFNLIFLVSMFMLLAIFTYHQHFNLNMNLTDAKINFMMNDDYFFNFTSKIIESDTNIMLIFLVSYLFYCMIVVIKISLFIMGPMRKMNYV